MCKYYTNNKLIINIQFLKIMWYPFKNNKRMNYPEVESNGSSMASHTEERKLDSQKAHIYNLIIVDESGSMSGLEKVTVDGINETISTIKKAQEDFADNQQHFLTLVTFDTRSGVPPVRVHLDAVPIDDIDGFHDYCPHGGTPLFDAMGETLTSLHERIKDDENATGVVTVITDGMENASHKWTGEALRQLIERLKEEGWTFSYMGSCHDVLSVTMQLSIDHVLEFDHDAVGASNTWRRDRSSKSALYHRLHREYNSADALQLKRAKMRAHASAYYTNRITPDMIEHLSENEVFVFGSNVQGDHTRGAAAFAVAHFDAVMGQGEGPQGQCYAIPTTGGLGLFAMAVQRFIDHAAAHPDHRFLVTRVGCGRAGFDIREVAQLFTPAINLENVSLPEEFWAILGLKMK